MSSTHKTVPSPDLYGPGTFVDKEFLPVPDDARRVLKILAKTTPGFTKDPRVWESVTFEGHAEPIIPGPLKAPVVAAALHAMCGIVGNELLAERNGQAGHDQSVTINTDHAAIWLGSILTARINGSDVSELASMGKGASLFKRDFEKGVFDNPLRLRTTAIYPTKTTGVWYQLHGSLNADPVLRAIGVDPATQCETPAEAYQTIREQTQKFTADELEMIMVKNGFCGSICYTPEGWKQTLMGKRLERHPLVNYSRESYAIPTGPVPLPALVDKRPLAGIKVVEMVRIIAGPVIGTTLAAFGADVIRVNCSGLPDLNALQLTLNAGVRTVDLDVRKDEDLARLHELVQDADVFIQGFRPGALARKGLGLTNLLEMAGKRGKGIVYVEENAYGPDGPFYERPGWQQIGDAASGSSYVTGRSLGYTDGTSVLPPLPISDMTTGLVGALGALMALRDRARHGGSYRVLSSLVAADAISLEPEIGLYSPDVVSKNVETFQWGIMEPSQYVSELLMVVLNGWKKVYPEYFSPESPIMTTFDNGHWGHMQLLSPVVKLGDSAVTPHWTTGPVPHCYYDRHISWL
ncbi:alpha methylacyl-CoA racemase [Aspergillus caelatus]|uniref:Alpha methylacyl-CoA racemase n=1 Tax=Aspergillus caelatus TaxID=61420 RepID=A0A5N7AB09_9EURO|nr:alpha methylacyl-CoA racemase [Aspergillus caelatus]KAE8366259.1 alpha methylacyl-CoA racemase [Aspergillus caelatus]